MGAVLKYWNGSAWVAKPLKYWNGSAWVAKTLKYWSGSAWISGAATVVYQDNFNRADANLEASPVASGGWSWVHDGLIAGAFAIASNALKSVTTNATGSIYKTPALASLDQYVQYRTTTTTVGTGPFVCCRVTDANNFIGIRTGNGTVVGQIEVYRRVSGTLSSLYSSATGAYVVGDIIRLEVSGTTFTVKKNGTVVTGPTAIGATFSSLPAGMLARNTSNMTFEDFEAGTL
jgi:hypothetical protein